MVSASTRPYIMPITNIHSTFGDAKKFYEEYGGIAYFENRKAVEITGLAQGTRNLIVGEPGIGKTELIGRIRDHFDSLGYKTESITLRHANSITRIEDFFKAATSSPKALFLDGLDEIQSSRFPLVLQCLESVSRQYVDVPIYISSRWVFISKHATSFPEFRFITISAFTNTQVSEYLRIAGHSEADIEALLDRVMSFSHRMLVLQIPRYLFYLEDFLQKKGVEAAAEVSRNELFEYFIYSKLDLEDKKLNADRKALIKRVLEKLALVMEIYQTNVLSMDELITFFDELTSDLKLAALSQVSFEVLFEYSLLKNNVDSIEYENTEFQEYLAAKETTRLSDPNRAACAFAVDPDINEIYPTWFNSLTFLVDFQRDLLEQLIEFSGLRREQFKVVDESFILFLSRIDPRNVSIPLRRSLFLDVIHYHRRVRQWLPVQLASALPGFFDSTLEEFLKSAGAEADRKAKEDSNRYVPLSNLGYVIGYLFRQGAQVDRLFWRNKFISYVSETNPNGVLQRHSLFALEELGDSTVVDELPNLIDADELVRHAFLTLCAKVAPDNPKSVRYFFDAVRKDDFYGRYGIFEMQKQESIKEFLKTFIEDEVFRREFLDDTPIFEDKDAILAERIEAVFDDQIEKMAKEVLIQSLHFDNAHNAENSAFVEGLWKLLHRRVANFVPEIVNRIYSEQSGNIAHYVAHRFLARVMEKADIPDFFTAMRAVGEENAAFFVMWQIKRAMRDGASDIYEAGRTYLPKTYDEWEGKPATPQKAEGERTLEEFKKLLEPTSGKFNTSVFDYYNRNAEKFDHLILPDDRKRLVELITETVFSSVNPADHKLAIKELQGGATGYSTSSNIRIFSTALLAAKRLDVDIRPYRQRIINFIPFAYSKELKAIFDLVRNIKPSEMKPVLNVYTEKTSDLWRHQPTSFIDAVHNYHITEAAPILKEFVHEKQFGEYARRHALTVLDSLASDPQFLKAVFASYVKSSDSHEKNLAQIANGLLVTTHADRDAIHWRLNEVSERVAPFIGTTGAHSVGDLEDELLSSKSFAKPLMQLARSGYEDSYLQLLDKSIEIWAKGNAYHAYATYLWDIIYAYFDNLKEGRSYKPLRILEKRIAEIKDREGANWLAGRMVLIRRSYLAYLGKPRNVSEAVMRYNVARKYDDKKIQNSDDLFEHLQDALDTDLRRWVEGEGAYALILGEKIYKGRQEYEQLVQKTVKTQIENILLKRGFQIEITREPDLLDDKRVDMLVRYGFVGPIVIEVKLTTNTDLKTTKYNESKSYKSMTRYMQGYGAAHGIFLIIDNDGSKNRAKIVEAFQKIQNVSVQWFECGSVMTSKRNKSTNMPSGKPKKKGKKK